MTMFAPLLIFCKDYESPGLPRWFYLKIHTMVSGTNVGKVLHQSRDSLLSRECQLTGANVWAWGWGCNETDSPDAGKTAN